MHPVRSRTETPSTGISRRTLAAGAAWAAPAVAMAAAAPAFAASLIKYPGINGWVMNTTRRTPTRCRYTLEVDSTLSGNGSDGAPYGLYLYDMVPGTTVSGAQLVYWIIGNQSATWVNLTGHSPCWGTPVRGTPVTKSDGLLYTPYTWTYICPIIVPDNPPQRLFLGDFHVRAAFTQPEGRCYNVTFWTQRIISIDTPNDGLPAQRYCYERRNGTEGAVPYQPC